MWVKLQNHWIHMDRLEESGPNATHRKMPPPLIYENHHWKKNKTTINESVTSFVVILCLLFFIYLFLLDFSFIHSFFLSLYSFCVSLRSSCVSSWAFCVYFWLSCVSFWWFINYLCSCRVSGLFHLFWFICCQFASFNWALWSWERKFHNQFRKKALAKGPLGAYLVIRTCHIL